MDKFSFDPTMSNQIINEMVKAETIKLALNWLFIFFLIAIYHLQD